MEKSDPAASKAMKQAAQKGQQQGIPQKQSNPKDQNGAAQQMQQNQQANAQQQHKEIDLGLEMILKKLKEADARKLRRAEKELAEHAEADRRAGHRGRPATTSTTCSLQDPKKITGR